MPKIVATAMSAPLVMTSARRRISYLEVVNTARHRAGGVYCTPEGRVERVRVTVSGKDAVGISLA